MKIKNHFNYIHENEKQEFNGGEKITQPNMALTPREIMKQYVRGGDSAISQLPQFKPIFNGDEEIPDMSKWTEQDRMDFVASLDDHVTEERKRLSALLKEAKIKDAQAAKELQDKFRKFIDSENKLPDEKGE